MKDKIVTALINLIKIKSIVTLALTATFVTITLRGIITEEQFIPIFTTIVGFYFGTQKVKETEIDDPKDEYVEQTQTSVVKDTDEYHEN